MATVCSVCRCAGRLLIADWYLTCRSCTRQSAPSRTIARTEPRTKFKAVHNILLMCDLSTNNASRFEEASVCLLLPTADDAYG